MTADTPDLQHREHQHADVVPALDTDQDILHGTVVSWVATECKQAPLG